MQTTYDPKAIEQSLYERWEKAGYFSPDLNSDKAPYCIMLPPPNVTGTLHMGHGFQVTLMDALMRYHRMCGQNTFWQAGTDHAGIATQMVVERQLRQAGKTKHDVGREAFLEKTWAWKAQSETTIKNQLRRMGASLDWSRERFSLDEGMNRAVLDVFVALYEEGLIYRGKRLVNWDPVLLTAVSDLEVIAQEEKGFLWYIRYPVVGRDETLIVATTRPETLLGDQAVAVHPEDTRYQHLIGQYVSLPLTDRKIPIIADTYVDPAFGTGSVKITPAHDFNDYQVGLRHQLTPLNIFTPSAHLNDQVPLIYQGLTREAARQKIVEDLTQAGWIEKIEPYSLSVPRGDRSGAIIEPYLTDQWYIKAAPLAEPAIKAYQCGELRFVPENWGKTYMQWLENIEDWCISRQLWWGHRIPVWYDEAGQEYVGASESHVREKYNLKKDVILTQDEDVLDTWFSASLWPFATLGWPEETDALNTFYPTQLLVTGFDILFFWVARMVMMGLKFRAKIPFQTVYVTGLIRDSEGHKMSKSKGNILDPIDLVEGITLSELIQKRTFGMMQPEKAQYVEKMTRREFPNGIGAFGTDALRFTYCALANTGRDIRFDIGRLEGYKNFCNKLWNATRYVMMHAETLGEASSALCLADRWILSQLQKTIQDVRQHFEQYRFDLLAQTLYEFTWNEYCDWYLEFSKPILTGDNVPAAQKSATRQTLVNVLEALLRLIHPIMPFVTEALWQRVAPLAQKQGDAVMLQAYPVYDAARIDEIAEADIAWLKKVVLGLRQLRSEMKITPAKQLALWLYKGTAEDKTRIHGNQEFLQQLVKITQITWVDVEDQIPPSAMVLVGELALHIPFEGNVDLDAEVARLEKELAKLQAACAQIQVKLENPAYVNKAPADVVEKERQRWQTMQETLQKITLQRKKLVR